MNRRTFLRRAGLASAGFALPSISPFALTLAAEEGWREFEITTRVEVLRPSGRTRIWVPVPLISNTSFQRARGNDFHAEGGTAKLIADHSSTLGMVAAQWPDGVTPVLTVASRVATRNCAADLSKPSGTPPVSSDALAPYRRPTKLLPLDGIVRATAVEITRGATTDLEKARAIYDWVCDNTFRDPETRGCGLGDIRFILESRNLGGKCADLNSLYVGLARASGLPARDVYGIRVAASVNNRSLGVASPTVTKSQHCRAQVYLAGYGWVPVDPADVRKVVLEEPPGHLPADHELVRAARMRLFGSWEMNWVAFNYAHDVALPGSSGAPIPFLMYPQAETAGGRLDSLDPDGFKYEIAARELPA